MNKVIRQLLGESQIKPVVLRDRVVKDADMVCPHCDEVIHEKGIGQVNGQFTHGKCGGVIKLPEPSPEAKAWLRDFANR